MKRSFRIIALVLALIMIAVPLSGCEDLFGSESSGVQSGADSSKVSSESSVSSGSVSSKPSGSGVVTICAGGDAMTHTIQITSAKGSDGSYDFTGSFKYVEKYFKAADISLVNLETTFGGAEKKYQGYPLFNAPDEFAYALKKAGVTDVCTSNNHSVDMGGKGLKRTLDVLKEQGLGAFGTRKTAEEKGYIIKEVNGIKIGFMAYTYQTQWDENGKYINGILVNNEVGALIDSFAYEKMDEGLREIEKRVKKMKNEGAEVIVAYMHWGTEYRLTDDDYQRTMAKALCNYGVDIIFGNHAHVVQPVTLLKSDVDGRDTLVAYAMGNFISNQREETLSSYENRKYTENSILLNVTIEKDFDSGKVSIKRAEYIPLWVNKTGSSKYLFEVVPCAPAKKAPGDYNIKTDAQKARVDRSYSLTCEKVESKYTEEMQQRVPFTLYDK